MNINKKMTLLAFSLVALLSTKGFAFGMMEVENWEFQFSGNVNAFVVSTECDAKTAGAAIEGGLACGSNGVTRDATNIRTGLLPSCQS